MTGVRKFGPAVLMIALAAFVWLGFSREAETAVGPLKSKVRLYSGDELVGEWEAVGSGRQEDGSYVFRVNRGVQEVEVRIQGTWSVEALP